MTRLKLALILMALGIAACQPPSDDAVIQVAEDPTATLQPILSQTPRSTATPVPTNTPFPTASFTPTETDVPPSPTLSPTPTITPTVAGIIQSLQRVNVRTGPGVAFSGLTSLPPGTGVQIIGVIETEDEGTWYNVRLEDGREGYVTTRLVFVPPTPTDFPTATPSPDLTALFLGTPLPTQVRGGGTITPTPPDQVRTGTAPPPVPTDTPGGVPGNIPLVQIDTNAINATATALVSGAATSTEAPTTVPEDATAVDDDERTVQLVTNTPGGVGDAPQPEPTAGLEEPAVRPGENGADVFAFCDDVNNRGYGIGAPTTLREGAVIDIWWQWFARTEEQVQEHIDAVNYELSISGTNIENVNLYVSPITQSGIFYTASWYIPFGPLPAGEYEIRYTATWDRSISDGDDLFGPGTDNPFDQEACTFTIN